jgi:putative transposase
LNRQPLAACAERSTFSAELHRLGERLDDGLVRKLIRELDLVAVQPKPNRHATNIAGETMPSVPDMVTRNFNADKPGAKLVGDITHIPSRQG